MILWSANHPTVIVINTPTVSYYINLSVTYTLCFYSAGFIRKAYSSVFISANIASYSYAHIILLYGATPLYYLCY